MSDPMPHATIRFSEMPWQPGAHPLERKKGDPRHPISLLEFAPGFADPTWCARGHAGYILDGSLRIEFEESTESIGVGDGFIIVPGTRHRASNPGATPVRLVIVSSEARPAGAS